MAIVEGTSNSANATGANSITLGITVASGVDCLDIDIEWSDGAPATISSVTVNGSSTGVTHIVTATGAGAFSQYLRASKYRLVAPSTGAQNVVVTFSGSQGEMQLGCTQLTGVDQTTPVRDSDSEAGDDATAGPLTLTTVSGDYVTDGFNGGAFTGAGDPTLTFGAGQTSRWQNTALANIIQAGGSSKTASGTSTAMDCTIVQVGEAIFAYAYVAASYIPAAAAAAGRPVQSTIALAACNRAANF